MGNEIHQRKSSLFGLFKKNKNKKYAENGAESSARARQSYNQQSDSASAPEQASVVEKPLPPVITSKTDPEQSSSKRQTLLHVQKNSDAKKAGAVSLTIIREPEQFSIQVIVDGEDPKDMSALQNVTDKLQYDHPSFKLMTAGDVVKLGSSTKDLDWSEIDPEIHDHYLGHIPGTVSISAFGQEIKWAIKRSQPQIKVTAWISPDLPTFESPDLVKKIRARNKTGLPASQEQAYNDLVKIMGEDAFAFISLGDETNFSKQCSTLIELLNNQRYWRDLSSMSSISGPMSTTPIGTNSLLYVILLAKELRLRFHQLSYAHFKAIRGKIKADMIVSKRWEDHFDMEPDSRFAAKFSFRSRIHEQQIAGLKRFAEIMEWPFLASARPKIDYAYRHFFKCMSALVSLTPEISYLGHAPHYNSGLVLNESSYWRISSPLGRIFGAASGAKACMNWVGPCPAITKGIVATGSHWMLVGARDLPTVDITSYDADLDDSDDVIPNASHSASPYKTDKVVQDFDNETEWIEPTPPQPLRNLDKTSRFEIVGVEVQIAPSTTDIGNPTPEDILYHASIIMKINNDLVTFNVESNPFFVCSHPCLGIHKANKRKLPAIQRNIVTSQNLKKITHWNGILVINVQGSSNAQVAARAWCAEIGRHALVKHPKRCFYCAWEQARQIHLKVIIYR
ncbi:hypothetical protein Unana1_06572 [Umbelopsis nana]